MDVEVNYDGKKADGYFRWNYEMDRCMLQVLRKQKNKGQKEDRNFSAGAYREVIKEINEKFGVKINLSKIVNRLRTLREEMHLAMFLDGKSGIGWNDLTKTFEAVPEVWQTLIQVNEKVKHIRGKPLPNLDLVCEIYEKDKATGSEAKSAKEKVQRWEKERCDMNIEDIDNMQANNEVHLESFYPFGSESTPTIPTTQAPSSSTPLVSKPSNTGKKRKARVDDQIMSELQVMSNAMKEIAQVIIATNKAIVATNPRVRREEKIFDAIKELGLEGRALLDSVTWLVQHPNFIGMFFACPIELRLEWLSTQMR